MPVVSITLKTKRAIAMEWTDTQRWHSKQVRPNDDNGDNTKAKPDLMLSTQSVSMGDASALSYFHRLL